MINNDLATLLVLVEQNPHEDPRELELFKAGLNVLDEFLRLMTVIASNLEKIAERSSL